MFLGFGTFTGYCFRTFNILFTWIAEMLDSWVWVFVVVVGFVWFEFCVRVYCFDLI